MKAFAQTQTNNSHKEAHFAALDLGTNNCRLLIAHPNFRATNNGRVLNVVDSYSRVVKLGEGMAANGKISDEAIARAKESLLHCAEKIDKYNVSKSRYVATEACRRAANAHEFVYEISRTTGLNIEIITAEEEAKLALFGCCSLLERGVQRALAFDIGGGSTEVMWVQTPATYQQDDDPVFPFIPETKGWMSIPHGVMSLTEAMVDSAYTELYFEEIVETIMQHLRPLSVEHRITDWIHKDTTQLLSTSGTVTTLAAIYLGLTRYDRARVDGVKLSVKDLQKTIRFILAMRQSERFMHPCIGPDRCEYILAGCAIFEAIVRTFPFHFITIADRGVREGVIMGLMMNGAQWN